LSEKKPSKKAGKSGGNATAPSNSPFDFGLLTRMVELMSANDLNTVDVRDGDQRVILKRGAVSGPVQMIASPAPAVHSHHPGTSASVLASSSATASPPDEESTYHRITSPMVGTFYTAPKPGEKAFVAVGSIVNEDTDVCIVEAMKTFNNIKAECRGTIARILVQDGHPVEFGTVLFLVKPS
jgi:acetyl-CoA carboxylase biotin carboxyl carrier protein